MRSDQPQGIISSYQIPKYQNEFRPTPSLEQVIEMATEYHRTKEDAVFEIGFAEL
jgi:hypothetical protein